MSLALEARSKSADPGWLLVAWSVACGPVVAALLSWTHSAWLAMLVYHAMCLGLGGRYGTLGPRPRLAALWGVGIASIVVVGVATGIVVAWVPETDLPMTAWRTWGLRPPEDTWILLYYVAVNPWAEELFWRGAWFGACSRRGIRTRLRAWVSTVGFALFHVFVLRTAYEDAAVVGTAVSGILLAGVLWIVVRLRTRNVWWCVVSHQGANVALAVVYLLYLRDRL